MKTNLTCLSLVFAVAVTLTPEAFAQRQLGKKKGPTSKIYLAETKGDSQIVNGERVYTAKQATAFDAPGTVIETTSDAHNAFVYSNGTGMFVDSNTRVEIDRFVQEPFKPERVTPADQPLEPSMSQSDVFVARGAIGLCTSDMVSGSTMNYGTPQGMVNIRGGRLSIETNEQETIVDVLDGDISVSGNERSNSSSISGQALRPGDRAIIRPGLPGQPPTITITSIPQDHQKVVDERVAIACNARKSVTFDIIEKQSEFGPDGGNNSNTPVGGNDGPDQEIVVRPTVPGDLPTNVVVSPDRLPGT